MIIISVVAIVCLLGVVEQAMSWRPRLVPTHTRAEVLSVVTRAHVEPCRAAWPEPNPHQPPSHQHDEPVAIVSIISPQGCQPGEHRNSGTVRLVSLLSALNRTRTAVPRNVTLYLVLPERYDEWFCESHYISVADVYESVAVRTILQDVYGTTSPGALWQVKNAVSRIAISNGATRVLEWDLASHRVVKTASNPFDLADRYDEVVMEWDQHVPITKQWPELNSWARSGVGSISNPLFAYTGTRNTVPRGMPVSLLDERARVYNHRDGGTGSESTLNMLGTHHRLRQWGVRQFLADDAGDLARGDRVQWSDLQCREPSHGAAGTFTPFNALSTLFERDALWAMWMPPPLEHGSALSAALTDPDVYRAYLMQPILWLSGLYVLHQPGVSRADGTSPFVWSVPSEATDRALMEFLIALGEWYRAHDTRTLTCAPSSLTDDITTFEAETTCSVSAAVAMTELLEWLIPRRMVSPLAVSAWQLWTITLHRHGYAFPVFTRRRHGGTLAVLINENLRVVLSTVKSWDQYLGSWLRHYPVTLFYVPSGWSEETLATIRQLAPSLTISFVAVRLPVAGAWKGGGSAACNLFLGYVLYRSDWIRQFDYMMRFDEDIYASHDSPQGSVVDVFRDMRLHNTHVGWKQHICDNERSLFHGGPVGAAIEYAMRTVRPAYNGSVSDVWDIVSAKDNVTQCDGQRSTAGYGWRPILVAGCVEMYHAAVFRNEYYFHYARRIGIWQQVGNKPWWEQTWKTLWMQMYVSSSHWRGYHCRISVYHKTAESIPHWFFYECDYSRQLSLTIGKCDADPSGEMRFC